MSARAVASMAVASLLDRRATVALAVMAVAVSVALLVGVEKIRLGARAGFERTIAGTDLIVGARSGPVNLLLSTVFHIGQPTNNISMDSYAFLVALPEVDWAVPLSLGDSYKGFRVVGTNADFFRYYRYGDDRMLELAAGVVFDDLFDAVIGAEVADTLKLAVGDEITLSHGLGAVSFVGHDRLPFRVTGVLAASGTPVDRSVQVTLSGIEAIHFGWHGGAPTAVAQALSAQRIQGMPLQPTQITASLVGLHNRSAVLSVQRQINAYADEPLQAVIPGVALAQVWNLVAVAERTLNAVAALVVAVGLLSILSGIFASLNERRREMAVLRAIGARPVEIFLLLVSESALIATIGASLGLALVYTVLAIAARAIETHLGVALQHVAPGSFDALVVVSVTGAAILLGCLPAWFAYRRSLSDGLAPGS